MRSNHLSGRKTFHLYETFGLPLDFMVDAARDAGVKFDDEGFERARSEEQSRARASWKGGSQKSASPVFRDLAKTDFLGYKQLNANDAEVLAIVKDGAGVPSAKAGEQVEIVLDHTSFYGDSGGQIGDTGWFTSSDGNTTIAEITGCVLPVQGVRAHKAVLKQDIAVGDHVNTVVDGARRDNIKRNHTGTHLLHAALRQVLGTHVKQAGSAVHPDRLRFDFSHFAQVADEELQEIEDIVNREVLANAKVETLVDVPIDVAVNEYHAMALFGEKYGDKVRVVKLSDGFSTELCGGTHTAATGEIGLLKLTGESAVSSGVRRLEAISGLGSLDTFRRDFEVAKLAGQYVPSVDNLTEGLRAKFASQEDELKRLRRELEEARMKSAAGGLDDAVSRATDVKGVKVLTHRADSARARTTAHARRQPQAEARRRRCCAGLRATRRQGRHHRRSNPGPDQAHTGRKTRWRSCEIRRRLRRRQARHCRSRRQRPIADRCRAPGCPNCRCRTARLSFLPRAAKKNRAGELSLF